MKKFLTLLLVLLFLSSSFKALASYGYFGNCGTFVEFGSTFYYAGACNSGNPALNGANLGSNLTTLSLNTIQQKTFQNGGDNVFNGFLNYRVYKQGATPGAFTTVNLTFGTDLGGGDYQREATPATNICSGLSGNLTYVFECYFYSQVTWNGQTAGTVNATIFESNSSNNFIATFTTNASLSVEYTNILAKPTNKGVNINWQTASERDNAYFRIERSSDGEFFSAIGEMKGAGNSQSAHDYAFTDVQPATGINYYRIKDVDINGVETTSKVVSTVYNSKDVGDKLSLSPNPVVGLVNINYNAQTEGNTSVNVYDYSGKLILSQIAHLTSGGNSVIVDVANLLSGVYIVKVNAEVQRFVKL